MERDLAGAHLTPTDFKRLEVACFRDIRFPRSFEDWSRLVAAGTKMVSDQGLPVLDIPIDVDDFLAWCHRVQVAPCLDGLRAYLILIRRADHVPAKARKDDAPQGQLKPPKGPGEAARHGGLPSARRLSMSGA